MLVTPALSRQVAPKSRQTRAKTPAVSAGRLAWPAKIFLISLYVPITLHVGSMAMPLYRIVLLLTLVPSLVIWLSGRIGKPTAADVLLLLYCAQLTVSLTVLHGPSVALQPAGSNLIDTMGAFLLARCCVRDAAQFKAMAKLLFILTLILLPLALAESILNRPVAIEVIERIGSTFKPAEYPPRWGFRRAQTVFEHPILAGVSTGAILALTFVVLCDKVGTAKRLLATGCVALTCFLSFSSGPIAAMIALQGLLLAWNWAMRKNPYRWRVVWAVIGLFSLAIALLSNQSVPEFLISRFAFDEESAYYRVLIWRFGSDSVLNHIVFGTGLGRWDRPDWMPPSIDMFWLIHAVQFGLLGSLFMAGAFLTLMFSVGFRMHFPAALERYRMAWLICMGGYFLAGWTVHFWSTTYMLFLFLLGSGAWFLTATVQDDGDVKEPVVVRRRQVKLQRWPGPNHTEGVR